MQYIYTRISTEKQETANQLSELVKAYPEAKVIEEITSGYGDKPRLNVLLDALRAGDTLIVYALDRLGRHTWKAIKLLEEPQSKGVTVVSKREGIDFSHFTGKLVASLMLSVAEMERNILSERTKAALRAKKEEAQRTGNGWTCGRRRTYGPEVYAKIHMLRAAGLTMKKISEETGVAASRICQILKAA